MTRTTFVLAFILLAFLLWSLLQPSNDYELGSGLQPAPTNESTPSTVWPQTMPTLPEGFDPTALKPRTKSKRPLLIVSGSVWDDLAECESHGNWSINTGNGYSGGLQMDAAFWEAYDGLEFAPEPWRATKEQQIVIAERGRAARGFTPWPHCARRLGLIGAA